MVTLAVVFLASSFKGEGADSEEGRFTCLLSDLGASCQPQWYHSILQGMHYHVWKEWRGTGVVYVVSVIERKDWVTCLHVVFLLCLSAKQVYSNNSEVATLYPNQTSFTLTELTPGTLYLISVGAFTGAGEGDREERMIKTDGPTVTPTGMAHVI